MMWFEALETTLDRAWQELGRAAGREPVPYPVFATIGRDGTPRARALRLRGADRDAATLTLYTDKASDKVEELCATPSTALHLWIPERDLQIRVQADARLADANIAAAIWAELPEGGLIHYGGDPLPNRPVATPFDYRKTPDPARFCAVILQIRTLETVHLGADPHRRALFRADSDFIGDWRAP